MTSLYQRKGTLNSLEIFLKVKIKGCIPFDELKYFPPASREILFLDIFSYRKQDLKRINV